MGPSSWSRAVMALSFALLAAPELSGQWPPFFRHFTPAHGLADREVGQVLQDAEGFIWVATNDGLNRFDGREWLTFRRDPQDPHSLPGNRITALASAADGRLWIGTADGGLCSKAPGQLRFERHAIPANTSPVHIVAVHVERDGAVLASVEKKGVFRRAVGSVPFVAFPQLSWKDHNRILCFADGAQGTLASCMGLGLVRAGADAALPISDTTAQYPWPGQIISTIWNDGHGVLWMGAWDNGLYRYDPTGDRIRRVVTLEHVPFTASGEEITAITGAPGGLWLGTKNSGLFHLDTTTLRFTRHEHRFIDRASITSNSIRSLYTDRAGRVWIGTDNGLDLIDPQAQHFRTLWLGGSIDAADLGDRVTGIAHHAGSIHVASTKGLWRGTDHGLEALRLSGIPANARFHAMHASTAGALLVGSDRSLHLLESGDRSVPMRGFHLLKGEEGGAPDPFDLPSSRVVAVADAHILDRPVWLASVIGHGILLVDRSTRVGLMEHVLMPSGPFENMFSGFHTDSKGRLWLLGRNTGLSQGIGFERNERVLHVLRDADRCRGSCPEKVYFTLQAQQHYSDEQAPRNITGMVELPDGTFHVASADRGLLHFDPARTPPFISLSAPHNKVEGIARDLLGRTWCVAGGGFDVYDPQQGTWMRIDPADGLPEKGVQGHIEVLGPNDFAVGSFGCIVRFDPAAVRFPAAAPVVHITHFRLFDRDADSLLTSGAIRLHHTQNFLSIAFTSFAFGSADKHRHHWQLLGVDPEPVDGGTRTEATYTNLKGGDLRFHVWAVNSAGIASDPVELALTIVPPFWERWWFFVLIAVLIAALVYTAYRYRIAQLQRVQQLRLTAEIEAQEKERKRIARDLHDDLGTRISTLKLYMGGLRGYLVPGEEAREVERNAVEILDESVSDLRNMLNDLSPETVSRYGYVRAVEELAQRISNSRVIEADVAVAGTPPRMDGARELALYRVTQELFNNSIKHSSCSRIHLRILHQQGRLEVLYEDNGKGMAITGNGSGHGLRNITNRLQLIGGTITWDSAPGQGLRAIIHLHT